MSYGTLTEDHQAYRSWGCATEQQVFDRRRGDTELSAGSPRVSRRLAVGEGSVDFDFAVEPVVTDDGATLTLTADARTEASHCGGGASCMGSSAIARFTWTGTVTLPSPRGYRVRVSYDAHRETDLWMSRYVGECQLETPWRVPVVVESGRQAREFEAPAGVVAVTLRCQADPLHAFASTSCAGASVEGHPSLMNHPSVVNARLTLRMEFTPKP